MQTGANVLKVKNKQDMYWKNAVVALFSAKHYMPECDVALVTNVSVPDEYRSVLDLAGVHIFQCEFDSFAFDATTAWGLAFYKLCALKAMLNKGYEYYISLDTDVFVQSSFEDAFFEMDDYILLHDRHPRYSLENEVGFNNEIKAFNGCDRSISKYGGEFVGGNKRNLTLLIDRCESIYKEMQERKFSTSYGDEFILSLVADSIHNIIKNADGYVCRYWTGSFRYITTNYKFDPVSILHVPAEKNDGMIRLYDYIILNNCVPSNRKAHRILHLIQPSLLTRFKILYKFVTNAR
ncbi:MAG: hypothetical protein LIP01_11250 [Tannerellaceae bacterium]|nr:hypothetical protein [Tannerellaceae bacterium]